MELIKDYDCIIDHHLGKANVVADTLSHKNTIELSETLDWNENELVKVKKIKVRLEVG
jgi:hypothetical protein